ncbi:MAG: hypothetical protein OXN96_02040 [Bryobacterales bacterium]|nr:hypothetical protein [Bryobacterales bacterium]
MGEFPEERVIEVAEQVGQLVADNRPALLGLITDGIIPTACTSNDEGSSTAGIDDALWRIELGERPFEEWMHARSELSKGLLRNMLRDLGIEKEDF